jgi:hypothetical protein
LIKLILKKCGVKVPFMEKYKLFVSESWLYEVTVGDWLIYFSVKTTCKLSTEKT